MWRAVPNAATTISPTTPARTGTAQSVRVRRRGIGWKRPQDLLPLEYFHVVFTLPTEIAQIAFWNKKAVYDLLFRA